MRADDAAADIDVAYGDAVVRSPASRVNDGSLLLDWLLALEHRGATGGISFHRSFSEVSEVLRFAECADVVARAAQHLLDEGVRAGDRVVYCFDSSRAGLVGFFALLWMGATPLTVRGKGFGEAARYVAYLEAISAKHGARFVVGADAAALHSTRVRLLEVRSGADRAPRFTAAPSNVAFVQFSSGSTSDPKGVVVTHDILARNLREIGAQEVRRAGDCGSLWLPLFHDMGLIGLLSGFVDGTSGFVAPPQDFLLDPVEWLRHLSREKVTVIAVPNFAIEYSLRALGRAAPGELDGLDLSSLRTIFLGSEMINVGALESWTRSLAPYGLAPTAVRPCYGMAEAVLMVTCSRPGQTLDVAVTARGERVACVGTPVSSFEIRVVDEAGAALPPGSTGEIWLRGGMLARAYLDTDRELCDAQGFYRTGDLGWLEKDRLYVLGRTGDRLKINAESFYATDLEHRALELPYIEPGRIALVQVERDVYCVLEVNKKLDARGDWLRELLARIETGGVRVLPEHMLVVPRGRLPKTSSGKLRRRVIAQAIAEGSLELVERGTAPS
jgi:acyl-CoA synthetase (AMP-forming)/AMP-acid ligase II